MITKATAMFLAISSSVSAAGLLDPTYRDEDISSIQISARIQRTEAGAYKYLYTLISQPSTKGTAQDLFLRMNCPGLEDVGQQESDSEEFQSVYDNSQDGRHVPVNLKVVGMPYFDAGFDRWNRLRTMVEVRPGFTRQFEILSSAKPGYLPFSMTVSHDREAEYDYSMFGSHEPISPRAPWYSDWVVSGLLMGPACPGSEATPITRPIFSGQSMPDEMEGINELLRYEVKGNRNRWHTTASETSVKLRVHYDSKINPVTFTATLNGRNIRSLFNPVAGGYQDVTIPLEGARTRIQLAVYPQEGRFEAPGEAADELHDIDPFEIRRPLP